jgi:hypothetical protein
MGHLPVCFNFFLCLPITMVFLRLWTRLHYILKPSLCEAGVITILVLSIHIPGLKKQSTELLSSFNSNLSERVRCLQTSELDLIVTVQQRDNKWSQAEEKNKIFWYSTHLEQIWANTKIMLVWGLAASSHGQWATMSGDRLHGNSVSAHCLIKSCYAILVKHFCNLRLQL